MAINGEWTSAKAAAEVRGARRLRVMEIDLTDPDGYGPNSGWYTTNKTLYLTDGTSIPRDTTSTTDKEYWPAVIDWGTVYDRGDIGGGLASISDARTILSNAKLSPQEPGETIKAGTGTSPEPEGHHIRLSQLMRYYEWSGAVVRFKTIYFEDPGSDQNSDAWQEETIFEGVIDNADPVEQVITLDVSRSVEAESSPLAGRRITDPPDKPSGDIRAPIAYGNLRLTSDDIGSFNPFEAAAIGYQMPAFPAVPLERDSTNPEDTRLIWNDAAGKNTGWTNQKGFGTAGGATGPSNDTDDKVYRYNQDSESFTVIKAGSSDGDMSWEDVSTATDTGEITTLINRYLEGLTYIPSRTINSVTGVTSEENAVDKDPATHAVLDLTSTSNFYEWKLSPSRPLGNMLFVDDAIVGWVAIKGNSITDAATRVQIGLYANGAFVGTVGTMNNTDLGTTALWRQDSGTLGGTITTANLTIGSANILQPVFGWDWKWGDGTSNYEIYMRVQVSVASGSADEMHIVGGGIGVDHDLGEYFPRETQQWAPGSASSAALAGIPSYDVPGFTPDLPVINQPLNPRRTLKGQPFTPAPDMTGFWVSASKASTDDNGGTLTGSARANIQSPPMTAAHILAKWGKDVSTGDMNLSTATTSAGFGSFRHAVTDLDEWLDDVTGGSGEAWESTLSVTGETTVNQAVAKICSECPMMVHRGRDGTWYAVVYPAGTINNRSKYQDSAGSVVSFHPNAALDGASDYGKPYSTINHRPELSPLNNIINDFTIRYRYFAPGGVFNYSQHVNPDDYSIWDSTANDFVTSSDTLGDAMNTLCSDSETRYGARWARTIDAPQIISHSVAAAYLNYLTTRFTKRRIIFTATAHPEAIDLKVGHVISLSDDYNLMLPFPAYKGVNWGDEDFIVQEVRHIGAAPMVEFRAEQLNPS